MAWSIRGTANWGTNTATVPTHSAGNMILVASFRDGNTTPPTLPSGQNLTNIYSTAGANSCSLRVAYKIATSSSETIGTFTNGTTTCCIVLENAAPGAFVQNRGSSTTFNYAALTFLESDNTSGAIGFCFSRDPAAAAATAPSGMTNHNSNSDATDIGAVHYDLTGTGWSSTNVATGVTATGWQTFVLEILDQQLPTNYFGEATVGSSSTGEVVATSQAGTRFEVPEDCTIDEIWVYVNHLDSAHKGRCGLYDDSSSDPNTVLGTGSEFNYNQFPAWRKSKGLSISRTAGQFIHAFEAYDDIWYSRYNTGTTAQSRDLPSKTYSATPFENPWIGTDSATFDVAFNFIIKYTPIAPPSNQNQFFFGL